MVTMVVIKELELYLTFMAMGLKGAFESMEVKDETVAMFQINSIEVRIKDMKFKKNSVNRIMS